MILVEVGVSMHGYVETHGSFRGMYSWKLQLLEAMEAPTSTDSGKIYVIPRKLPLTFMEVNLLPPTSMEISMEVDLLPPAFMEVSMAWKLPWKKIEKVK